MTSSWWKICCMANVCLAGWVLQPVVNAAPFTASYLDGGTWSLLYGQGFNAFVNDGLSEPLNFGDPIPLSRFEFYKSGDPDTGTNIQLVILSELFPNLDGLTTASPLFVGVSTNTIASTVSIPTAAPIRFNFDNLELVYGNYYAAIYANIDELGNITPVHVPSLTADYELISPGPPEVYAPISNYDFDPNNPTDYLTSAVNFIQDPNEFGTYFVGFGGAGDANFTAYFDYDFPAGTPGDFDGDDDVDGRDFLIWQRGSSPMALSASDLADWQNGYGTVGLAALSAVPEPSAIVIASMIGMCMLVSRKRI